MEADGSLDTRARRQFSGCNQGFAFASSSSETRKDTFSGTWDVERAVSRGNSSEMVAFLLTSEREWSQVEE